MMCGFMKQFVLLNEIISDVILDSRYYSDYNFVGTEIDGYLEACAIVTLKCSVALKKVSEEIKKYGKIYYD